jgi:hypothetical protein
MSIPRDPDALLTREQTAAALTEAGFPVSKATLSTKATRGGGPPYQKFGPRPLYQWRSSLDWAKARLSPPVSSTSEAAFNSLGQQAVEPEVNRPTLRREQGTQSPQAAFSEDVTELTPAAALPCRRGRRHKSGDAGPVMP